MPKASKTKANTTLTEFSQPPDLGILASKEGNRDKRKNGNPIAKPKKNIPRRGFSTEVPMAASTSKVATKGPVQEKDTIARTAAMKKAEM